MQSLQAGSPEPSGLSSNKILPGKVEESTEIQVNEATKLRCSAIRLPYADHGKPNAGAKD
jgi:hypothetical protein